MKNESRIKIGFVGFGEINTPIDLIINRCNRVVSTLRENGLEVVSASPVTDDAHGDGVTQAVHELSNEDFSLLIVCVAGWIPTWAVISVIEPFKHIPMILLGLSGWDADGRFITTADQAGTTALRAPMQEMGFKFKYIVNFYRQAFPLDEVLDYCKAAAAFKRLKTAKIGMAGYRDMRLYATTYDAISLKMQIGPEIEHFDLLELKQGMDLVDAAEIERISSETLSKWEFINEPRSKTIQDSIRLFCAIYSKIEDRHYSAFSYCDVDGIKKLLGFAPAGALTLLHDHVVMPTIPENDTLGSVTQLILHFLTGQVAAYLEFYEFTLDGALMGVPDYVPHQIVSGKTIILPNSFGDFGEGLLNISKIKGGAVTLARIGFVNGKYVMHVIEGIADSPPSWEEAGWAQPAPQLPSLLIKFSVPVDTFIQKVLGQHYIILYGSYKKLIRDYCIIAGVDILE